MVRKIVLGVLLIGFSGVLIYGAILRTSGRTVLAQVNAEDDRRNQQDAHDYDLEKFVEQRGSGGGAIRGEGNGYYQETSQLLPEELPNDWIDQQGLVESIDSEAIALRTTQGDLVLVEGRAWLFMGKSRDTPQLAVGMNGVRGFGGCCPHFGFFLGRYPAASCGVLHLGKWNCRLSPMMKFPWPGSMKMGSTSPAASAITPQTKA